MSAAEERLSHDPRSELWGEHRARYRFACQFAVGGKRVLDVASGAGFGLQMLRAAGAQVVGLDYDAQSLAEVRARAGWADLVRGDATRLPFGDATFDVVASFETLEHVPDATGMVRELRRVLKGGGRLILSTPNREFGPLELHANNPFHVQEFSGPELRELLGGSFSRISLYGQVPVPDYRYVPFLMVDPHREPRALLWKAQVRLPYGVRDALARAIGGRSFYPGEADYRFALDGWQSAHALVAVAE